MPFRRMPEGTRCRTVFLPPITRVCPALCPPWKRTTPCAYSVSQSTTLPLPSSPHWVPMTTTLLFTWNRLSSRLDAPLAAISGQATVAAVCLRQRGVAFDCDDYRNARIAQRPDCRQQRRLVGVGRKHATAAVRRRHQCSKLARIQAESRRRAPPPECGADVVVATPAADRRRMPVGIGRKHDPVVIIEVAQLGEVHLDRDRRAGKRLDQNAQIGE